MLLNIIACPLDGLPVGPALRTTVVELVIDTTVVPTANPVVVIVIPGTTLVVDATTNVVPELPAEV